MKTLVVYYSLSGKTEIIVRTMQDSLNADIIEIQELSDRSRFNAYTLGCILSRMKKASNTYPMEVNTSNYDNIVIATPLWGGYPAPAIYNFIRGYQLSGKNIYGLITYSKNLKNAESVLKKEFDKQGLNCRAIILVRSDSATIESLESKEVFFDIDKDNRIILRHRDDNNIYIPKPNITIYNKDISQEIDLAYNRSLGKTKK